MNEESESAPATPETKSEPETVERWAKAKGHIPDPKRLQFHRGPHVRVVMVHNKLAINSPISEADYDKAVEAAYSIPVR